MTCTDYGRLMPADRARPRPGRRLLLAAPLLPLLAACGRIPADSRGTTERVRGGTLRVGVSPNPPATNVADDGSPSGDEVDLAAAFARTLDAEPAWTTGAESALATELETGGIDLWIGGLDDTSPWTSKVALTRPYRTVEGPDGKERKLVMAVRMGENRLLTALERFLAHEEGEL